MRKSFVLLLLFLQGCSLQSFFYYPNRILYADPDKAGLPYELVSYPSLNGKKLYGLYFHTTEKPKGTIVHFHGNFGNVSNHFPLALFLVKRGFDVLSFDYEGYGASEGKPTAQNLVNDGIATVRYAQAHLRNPQTGVCVLGQSLGGAVAIVVTAKEPLVKGAVIEAAFSGYRAMGSAAMRRHVITWPLIVLVPFLGNRYDPVRFVSQISPRPLLFIHGDKDTIVPVAMSRRLFAAAKEPKDLWIIEGAGHLEGHRKAGSDYETRVTTFFENALRANQSR